jgi:hypothetical protein
MAPVNPTKPGICSTLPVADTARKVMHDVPGPKGRLEAAVALVVVDGVYDTVYCAAELASAAKDAFVSTEEPAERVALTPQQPPAPAAGFRLGNYDQGWSD